MSKFKVGDKVRLTEKSWAWDDPTYNTGVLTISKIVGTNVYFENTNLHQFSDSGWIELITNKDGDKPMARRTFKQTKSSPTHPKGTLFQEQCEDGTQPYVELGQIEGVRVAARVEFIDRALVEDQPEWFVEVFKVEPEYMTREELDQYNEFVKKPKKGRPAKVTKPVGFGGGWTEERRKAHSKRMKKQWKARKAV